MIPPISEVPDPHERLRMWQAERAFHAERRQVTAAAQKPASERTEAEWSAIAYSSQPGGTAPGCSCKRR